MVSKVQVKAERSPARLVAELERRIIEGAIPAGTRLVERALCDEYAVSRTVVREGLLKLAARGLIAIVPEVGATVTPLLDSKLRDAYVFREAIEAGAAEQCAQRMNREQTQALLACAALFGKEYEKSCRGEPSRLLELEEQFHRSIIEGSNNEFFISSWREAWVIIFRGSRLRPTEMQTPEKREVTVDDHQAIAQAIAAGNAEAAGTLMSLHIRSGRDLLIETIRSGKMGFDPVRPSFSA